MIGRALTLLEEREAAGDPLRFGLIGAGKFGTMLLSQTERLRGLELAGVADLSADRARAALATAGWDGADRLVTDDALAAIEHGRHVVMVTVEGDVLAGPALAQRARSAGVVYSLAYGDQPALVCELVGWARASGFEVVCAGKGTKYLPAYHAVTPDAVWEHYGIAPENASAGARREDVHVVPGRHEVRDRDGGDLQRDRPRAPGRRASLPALPR